MRGGPNRLLVTTTRWIARGKGPFHPSHLTGFHAAFPGLFKRYDISPKRRERMRSTEKAGWGSRFVITRNNPPSRSAKEAVQRLIDEATEAGLKVVYAVIGLEVGKSGTPHWQVYMETSRSVRVTAVMKLKGYHVMLAKGTAEQNRKYCSKEGNFSVHGTTKPGRGQHQSLSNPLQPSEASFKQAYDLAVANRVEMVEPGMKRRYYNSRKQIAKDEHKPDRKVMDWKEGHPPNLWIVGEPGKGKSAIVRTLPLPIYDKGPTKWWDGYSGEPVVVIDDLHESASEALPPDLLNRMGDRYPTSVECKFGMLTIRPEHIFITSNISIRRMYGQENYKALSRRFREVTPEQATVWFGHRIMQFQYDKELVDRTLGPITHIKTVMAQARVWAECVEPNTTLQLELKLARLDRRKSTVLGYHEANKRGSGSKDDMLVKYNSTLGSKLLERFKKRHHQTVTDHRNPTHVDARERRVRSTYGLKTKPYSTKLDGEVGRYDMDPVWVARWDLTRVIRRFVDIGNASYIQTYEEMQALTATQKGGIEAHTKARKDSGATYVDVSWSLPDQEIRVRRSLTHPPRQQAGP